MNIHLINPNTTAQMTEKMVQSAKNIANSHTKIIGVTPDSGPVSIESHYDEAIAAVGVLEQVRQSLALQGTPKQVDAYIIACFGDPALLAAREMTTAPVIGIAEAAFHMATLVSTKFSIVTTLARTGIIAEHLLEQYGMANRCSRIRAAEIPVLALENDSNAAFQLIVEECLRAKEQDDIGAIVLGCGGMADLKDAIAQEVGLPIIEGVTAATKLAEALVGLRLTTSKFGDLAFPLPKTFTGKFSYLSDIDMES